MNAPLIAPSLLSADFSDIKTALEEIYASGADMVHLDVMDGKFVPPITFGTKMVADIRRRINLPLDVHLMIVEPERHVREFANAGADLITFHPEVCVHSDRLVSEIKSLGKKVGISIVPSTPLWSITELLPIVDLVLVMTVNPGYGGQPFISSCLKKVETLRTIRKTENLSFKISVDGGVSLSTIADLAKAGPDILVAGSAFFGAKDRSDFVASLKRAYNSDTIC